MKKIAKLLVVSILLLGGVSLLVNPQAEADNTLEDTARFIYLGQDQPRIQLVFDGVNLERVCFLCEAYNIDDSGPNSECTLGQGDCDSGWIQGVVQSGFSLCAIGASGCIASLRFATSQWGPPIVGFSGENAPWHC